MTPTPPRTSWRAAPASRWRPTRGCAGARGWRSRSPTGRWAARTPGCGRRRRSTRPPRGRSAPHWCTTRRRSPGPTAASPSSSGSRSARSCCRSADRRRPDPRGVGGRRPRRRPALGVGAVPVERRRRRAPGPAGAVPRAPGRPVAGRLRRRPAGTGGRLAGRHRGDIGRSVRIR